jgi:hypothetical protein
MNRSPSRRPCLGRRCPRHPTGNSEAPYGGREDPHCARRPALSQEHRRIVNCFQTGFGERRVLKPTSPLCAAERWRGLRFAEFGLRQTAALRKDLDDEYEAAIPPPVRSSQLRVSRKSAP